MKEFTYEFTVLEHHLDSFSHVNNASYLKLYEEARWDFITNNGYGLERILKEQVGPVVLEATIKFRKELTLREKIIIHSKALEHNGKLLTMEQKMVKSDGSVASTFLLTVGVMDLKERKLIEPPEGWLKAVGF